MSETRAYVVLIATGTVVTGLVFVGLHLVGGDRFLVPAVMLCIVATCLPIGYIPERFPRHRRR